MPLLNSGHQRRQPGALKQASPGVDGPAHEPQPVPGKLLTQVWELEPLPSEVAHSLDRSEAGLLLDRLAVRVARGRGALDVRLGRALAGLRVGDRLLRLGYSRLGDYAREELGMSARAAQGLARLARELRSRPLLCRAVEAGLVSSRRAQVVLPVTGGEPEVEAHWVELARTSTVRALTSAVLGATGAEETPADEPWSAVEVDLSAEGRATVDRALDIARRVLGGGAARWQCIEAMCQEYLSSYPEPEPAAESATLAAWLPPAWLDDAQAYLETAAGGWGFLDQEVRTVAATVDAPRTDPFELHRLAVELSRSRERWDALIGRLAMLIEMYGLWRDMQFVSFGHYCRERLGLSGRAVQQRAYLERRLWELEELREAMRSGALSYSKALSLARVCCDARVDVVAEIAWARTHTCQQVQARMERLDEELRCGPHQDFTPPSACEPAAAPASTAAGEPEVGGAAEDAREAAEDVAPSTSPSPSPLPSAAPALATALVSEETGAAEGPVAAGAGPGPTTARAGGAAARAGAAESAADAAQMCALNVLRVWAPLSAAEVVNAAFEVAGRVGIAEGAVHVPAGERLVRIAEHFIAVWGSRAPKRRGHRRHPEARSGGICEAPGCTRPAAHVHHVVYRSQQGSDGPENLVDVCAAHHLHCLHRGWMRVQRSASGELVWELGIRNGVALRTIVIGEGHAVH